MGRATGVVLLALTAIAGLAAPVLAPHGPDERFRALLHAPPTIPHLVDDSGGWHVPFVYPMRLASRLEQRFDEDRASRVPLKWMSSGRLVTSSDDSVAPLLLLGGDSYGRDVFARLLYGARISLGLAIAAAVGAVALGLLVGGIAGYVGGGTDEVLMRASEFVLVLPAVYVALALRAVLPLVLPPSTVFLLLVGIFSVLGAPFVARGVRTIVGSEKRQEYVIAAESLGAGHLRLLGRHLLPAAGGFLVVQLTVLVPAFVVAEATLSYVGLGFPDQMASWGAMLHDASGVRTFADFPWLLSPAVAIFAVVLGLNLVLQQSGVNPATMPSNETFRRFRAGSHPV